MRGVAQLSSAQRKQFSEDGFLVLPGFFTENELAAAAGAYDRLWHELPGDVVVDSEVSGRRMYIRDLTEEERRGSFKVNDLYLRDENLRKAVLSDRLGAMLRELLEDDPVIINTLSVERGTQQADHLDTLFMTPPTPGHLLATWVAIEDVDADAGPLRYYPGSNHIEPYRFEDGGYHVRNDEMPRWAAYMAGAVERHGLEDTRFLAKRGDLFIWDAWLLHGGSEIGRPDLTRKSLITHYFTKTDCEGFRADLRPTPGGWYWNRAPQTVAPSPEAGGDPQQPATQGPAGLWQRLRRLTADLRH